MTDQPADGGHPGATLLIRAWSDSASPGTSRARLLTAASARSPVTWSAAAGDAAIAQEVLRWLRETRGGDDAPTAPPAPTPSAATGGAAPVPPLVDAAWLRGHLTDPGLVVVDVDDESGRYATGHVPGAVRVDFDEDLHHPTQRGGPTSTGFAALMDRHGVRPGSHVVLCGDSLGARAAWAHWCFTRYGHERVSLLDGGRARWAALGHPVSRAASERPAGRGYPERAARDEGLTTRDQVLAGLVGAPAGTTLVDCRSANDFAGRPEHPYDAPVERHRMVGRIPGAVHLPVTDLLDPATGQFLAAPALREVCARRGIDPEDQVTAYCGAGDLSALVWFALYELLGFPDVRCYAGGWAEYGSLTGVPTELDD